MPRTRRPKSKRKTKHRAAKTAPKRRVKPGASRQTSRKPHGKPRKARTRRKNSSRAKTAGRPTAAAKRRTARTRKLAPLSPQYEAAIKEMNRGRSLTTSARRLHLPAKELRTTLRRRKLVTRKGKRWVSKDDRLRRVPVMTDGRFRVVTVRGYERARLVGEHHNAVGEFVRTNQIKLIKPFKGKSVEAANGREYPLETDPNALHRIAAMDTPPFHEIYEITSNV